MIGGTRARLLPIDVKQSWIRPRHSVIGCAVLQIGCGDLCLARLVNIAEAEQLGAARPNVPHLDNSFANLLLQIQIEVLRVRSSNVSIRTEEVWQAGESRKDGRVRDDYRNR